MAMSAMYTTINGVLYHENRGGVETEYVPDTLGSLIQCRNSSGTATYTAEYWPYGEVRTETGSKSAPWGFVGLLGYLTDQAKRLYVRARHLRVDLGQWMTVDPLWPGESAYGYVAGSTTLRIDPSGMQDPFNEWGSQVEKGIRDFFNLPQPGFSPSPPIGGGRCNYNPTGDPTKFHYGNCCGAPLKCGPSSPTKDCLDEACKEHDNNIPDELQYARAQHHCQLAHRISKCVCSKRYKPGSLDLRNCEDAQIKIHALHAALCTFFLLARAY